MNRPCRSILFLLLLWPALARGQDYAEEMVPPPLDLDIRGTSLLWAGSPQKQAVALTFDDGPIPGKTDAVLAILREQGIKATFFMVGERVQASPDLARQVALEGHDIGNHSQTHRNLTKLGSGEVIRELNRCQDAIAETLGFKPTLFRAPYGAANMTTLAALSHLSLSAVFWSIDTRDWKAQSEAEVQNSALKGIKNGDVILFHEHSRYTVGALPGIISAIREKGFAFETVSALFDRPQAAPALIASATSPIQPLAAVVASPEIVEVAKAENPPGMGGAVSLGGSETPPAPTTVEVQAVPAPQSPAQGGNLPPKPESLEVRVVAESPQAAVEDAAPEDPVDSPPPSDEPVPTTVAEVRIPSPAQGGVAQMEVNPVDTSDQVEKAVPPAVAEVAAPVPSTAEAEVPQIETQTTAAPPVEATATEKAVVGAPKALPPKTVSPKTGPPIKASAALAKSDKPFEEPGEAGRVRRLQPVARFKQRLITPEPTEPPAGQVAKPRRLIPRASAGGPLPVESEFPSTSWGYASPNTGLSRP
ncbi:MAG: polysaccharide deacetylase family protein [Candidatus Omnitrophica bacterium]|nr:polysaccharide deacetylase family protein [Candidatus Omnitrophota bacterium]